LSIKPYKFTDIKKAKFLELLSEGSRRGAAAKSIGISRQIITEFAKDNEEFRNAIDEAEMDANEVVEDALYKAACKGNVVAIQVWLYNRVPDKWTDKRNVEVRHSGNISNKTEELSDEELANIVASRRSRGASEEKTSS
jgi:hypothetical protein